jgi:hypothetical protein
MLEKYAAKAASVLIAEPGFPRCGEFISMMRNMFLDRGRRIVSPCPHDAACPVLKERWCHFAFETKDAPAALHKISQAAGLPKERAVMSFLYTGIGSREWGVGNGERGGQGIAVRNIGTQPGSTSIARTATPTPHLVRVISDAFPLPANRYGRYCCSRHGLVLLAGERNVIEKAASGELINAVLEEGRRDSKSGALVAYTRR